MNFTYFINVFKGLKLSSSLRESRVLLSDYLEEKGYTITADVPVPGSGHCIDVIATDDEGKSFAIVIGNKHIRTLRLNLLKGLDMPKIYLLRDHFFIEKSRSGVIFINVPIYK